METKSSQPFLIKLNGKWVNVESWAKLHPGGADPLERYRGLDATDPFTSIHGPTAVALVEKMKAVTSIPAQYEKDSAEIATPVALSFRQFREQLVQEGWFERNWLWDLFYLSLVIAMVVSGVYVIREWEWHFVGSFLLGLAMQQGGWLGHDYVHGRGTISYILGRGYSLLTGFSNRWWSSKHNTHHVHTNQMGVDLDIANDPILHLWIPSPDKEFPLRRFQHLYYHFVYSFLYLSWRMQSFSYSWEHKLYSELLIMGINYLWMFALIPVKDVLLSILIGGWLVAEIVTATHQSEEILDGIAHNFVEIQFRTTRDVVLTNPFLNWLWGGMQYQLEHHLFPTMPKYRYGALTKKVAEWASKNGVEYRSSSAIDILHLNYQTMKKFAAQSSKEHAQ